MSAKKVKRWIVPGEGNAKVLVVAGGKREKDAKFIIKALEKAVKEHLTLKITENAEFDLHLTKETKPKTHIPLVKGRIDVEQIKKRAKMLYKKSLNPIDIRDPGICDYILLIPKYDNAFQEFEGRFYTKGDKYIVPNDAEAREIAEHLEEYFHLAFMDEFEEYESTYALWISSDEKQYGILFREEKKYYLFSISEAIKILPEAMKPEKAYCPKCGTETRPEAKICYSCGLKLD